MHKYIYLENFINQRKKLEIFAKFQISNIFFPKIYFFRKKSDEKILEIFFSEKKIFVNLIFWKKRKCPPILPTQTTKQATIFCAKCLKVFFCCLVF